MRAKKRMLRICLVLGTAYSLLEVTMALATRPAGASLLHVATGDSHTAPADGS